MKRILYGSEPDFPNERIALTIGSFDGVHLGHRKLIERLVEVAREKGLKSMVLTFDPHPAQVLCQKPEFWRLFDLEDQVHQCEGLGVDYFSVVPFEKEVARLNPEEFLQVYLFNCLNLGALVVGYDFQFGVGKSGTFDLLEDQCASRGIYLESVAALELEDEAISSTRIRNCISRGSVVEASEMLGRPFYVRGKVTHGDGRGREIGFPTANILIEPSTLPMSGVYATRMIVEDKRYDSVSNLGVRPTFSKEGENPHFLETYAFDLEHEIYEQSVTVEFLDFIRPEKRFNGLEELVRQIKLDVIKAKEILG